MKMGWTLTHFVLVCGLSIADAGVTGIASTETSAISPTLRPTSDKKFFGKDYPWDKRPKVDVLHFKHPYPAVQDSDDFDRDFVKDENSDNGSWKAQMEYDRLRHRLRKEKADVAKALAAKSKAEKELQDAMKREKDQKEKKVKKEKEEKEKEEKKKKEGAVSSSKGDSDEKEEKKVRETYVVPGKRSPGGVTSPGDVKVAVDETQKAMDALDECKEQLAKARKALKDLLKELEEAKKKQRETEAALDAALERLKRLQAGQAALDKAAEKERQEYLAAKAAYEKQQAVVAKMEEDIKISAAKVKAMRDAEDKDGGVYNTGKNAAARHFGTPVMMLMLVVLTAGTVSIQ